MRQVTLLIFLLVVVVFIAIVFSTIRRANTTEQCFEKGSGPYHLCIQETLKNVRSQPSERSLMRTVVSEDFFSCVRSYGNKLAFIDPRVHLDCYKKRKTAQRQLRAASLQWERANREWAERFCSEKDINPVEYPCARDRVLRFVHELQVLPCFLLGFLFVCGFLARGDCE